MFTFATLPHRATAGTLMNASSSTSGLILMIIVVVLTLALFGATTWSALQQPLARNPDAHHRLTGALLTLSLTAVAALITAALVI